MRNLKLTICQFNPVVGNPIYNAIRMIEIIEKGAGKGEQLFLFGELALAGYYSQDLFSNPDYIHQVEEAWQMLKYAAEKLNVGVGTGLPRRNPSQKKGQKQLLNSFRLYYPNCLELVQDKILLPTYSEFDEYRWFESGALDDLNIYRIGDQTLAFVICEDGWNSPYGVEDPAYRLYEQDPISEIIKKAEEKNLHLDLLINISASPDYIGKQFKRIKMNQKIAKHYSVPMLFLNVVGAQDELVFGGRSFLINRSGELVFEMKAFREELKTLELSDLGNLQKKSFGERSIDTDMADLDGMMGLYLKDYFRKSGLMNSKGVTLNRKLFIEPNPVMPKWALYKMGMMESAVMRLPMVLPELSSQKRLEELLKKYALISG